MATAEVYTKILVEGRKEREREGGGEVEGGRNYDLMFYVYTCLLPS